MGTSMYRSAIFRSYLKLPEVSLSGSTHAVVNPISLIIPVELSPVTVDFRSGFTAECRLQVAPLPGVPLGSSPSLGAAFPLRVAPLKKGGPQKLDG